MNSTILANRFAELSAKAEELDATKKFIPSEYCPGERVDGSLLLSWKVRAHKLISDACGPDSEYYTFFSKIDGPSMYRTNAEEFIDLRAIFDAVHTDFKSGYLGYKSLIQADIFNSELDQANELIANGYITAAAVIAGIVLETKLRQMCHDRSIPAGKLDKMNSDLVKCNAYSISIQKRITSLADIRNNAAHGHPEKFKGEDVSDMISYVERFISDYR